MIRINSNADPKSRDVTYFCTLCISYLHNTQHINIMESLSDAYSLHMEDTIAFNDMAYVLLKFGQQIDIILSLILICIECFTTTFLHTHSWLNWVDENDDEDEVGLKEKPEDTRYIKKITSN